MRTAFFYVIKHIFEVETKKNKKNEKKCKKICTFQKNVVSLQRQTKKTTTQPQLVTLKKIKS